MSCGTYNILQNILHIQLEWWNIMLNIVCPAHIVVDMNNVMNPDKHNSLVNTFELRPLISKLNVTIKSNTLIGPPPGARGKLLDGCARFTPNQSPTLGAHTHTHAHHHPCPWVLGGPGCGI